MCTPHTDTSKQGQNSWHSERPVYVTAIPWLENLCKSSLEWGAANRLRRLRQTALCSYTYHYHLSWVCALLLQPCAMCNQSWCIGLAWLPYSFHLVISAMHCLYLVPNKALLIPAQCMLVICITFIILFLFNITFPKREVYPCTCCKGNFHHTQLDHEGLCEQCFLKICSQSDGFAWRGHCIDALDDGTVDLDKL